MPFARVYTTLELFETTDAAYEVDAFVGAQIGDTDYVAQNVVRRNCHIKHTNGVIVVICAEACSEFIPAAFEIEGKGVQSLRMIYIGAFVFDYKRFLDFSRNSAGERPLRSRTTRL